MQLTDKQQEGLELFFLRQIKLFGQIQPNLLFSFLIYNEQIFNKRR